MAENDEPAFARRLKALDEGAWEEFAGRLARPLLAFVCRRFGCGRETAEEVVQMALVRAVRSIGTFKPQRGTLFAWLKAIAANEGHTLARRDARRREIPLSSLPAHVAEQIISSLDGGMLPDEFLEREELRALVNDVLLSLRTRHMNALLWKYVDGMTVAEMAARNGESEKAVESLLARARTAFRGAFEHAVKQSGAEGYGNGQ